MVESNDPAQPANTNPIRSEAGDLLPLGKHSPISKRPRLWTVWLVFILAFTAAIIASALATLPFILPEVLANPGKPPGENDIMEKLSTPFAFIAIAFPPQLAIMLAALIAATLSPISIRDRLGFTKSGLSGFQNLIVGLSVLLPGAIGMVFAYLMTLVIEPDSSAEMMWQNMGPLAAIPFVLFIALMPGFGEEMLFRGYIQRRLLQRWRPALAILISSLLFAMVHVMPHAVVFAFPVGLWLGYVAWKTDSIWPTILCHILINGIWNILNISSNLFGFSRTLHSILLIALMLIGIVTFIWSWRLLQQNSLTGSIDS